MSEISILESIEDGEQPLRRSSRRLTKGKPAAVTAAAAAAAAAPPKSKKGKRAQPETTAASEHSEEEKKESVEETLPPPSAARPELVVVEPRNRSLGGITAEAKMLRERDPSKYGVKGARDGMPGYVKNGWKMALADAAAALGCKSKAVAKNKQAQKTLTRQQKEAKQAYLEELRLLQVKYFPLIGRKVSAKAIKQATKKKEEEESDEKV